ncbi:hypothetical protein P376_2776 [Streptomyces sp. HCCB10043]|nr:hypothetical protein P376_2776 [Streptomyces sp. HCCB10043]
MPGRIGRNPPRTHYGEPMPSRRPWRRTLQGKEIEESDHG